MRSLLPLLVLVAGCSAAPHADRTHVTPDAMREVSDALEFSQAVRVGRTVYVSGQVGYGPEGIPDDVAAQSRLAFANLRAVLAEAGATLADVVEITTYHTDMAEMGAFMGVKSEVLPAPFPAWTAVGVTALAEPGLCVEVSAMAVVGSGAGR